MLEGQKREAPAPRPLPRAPRRGSHVHPASLEGRCRVEKLPQDLGFRVKGLGFRVHMRSRGLSTGGYEISRFPFFGLENMQQDVAEDAEAALPDGWLGGSKHQFWFGEGTLALRGFRVLGLRV